MNRLLSYDFSRLFHGLTLYFAGLAAIAAGVIGALLCPGYQSVMAYSQAYLFLIPIGVILTVVFITTEYNYGILRNKVVNGFSRMMILQSWVTVLAVAGIILVAVYNLSVLLTHLVQGRRVFDNMTPVTVLANFAMVCVMLLVSTGFENILAILFVFFALGAVALIPDSLWRDSAILKTLFAVIPSSHLRDSIVAVPQSVAATLIGGMILVILLSMSSMIMLMRKDLE